MRAMIRLILIPVTVATTVACLPVTDMQQTNGPPETTTSGPALSALKPISPHFTITLKRNIRTGVLSGTTRRADRSSLSG
jgi:hypothetical protein